MDHLDSPQIRVAAKRYADAVYRHETAPFWRRRPAAEALQRERQGYVRAVIATAEARRLEQA